MKYATSKNDYIFHFFYARFDERIRILSLKWQQKIKGIFQLNNVR